MEGSYRLIRIRKIKRGFYIMQLVLALALGIVISFMVGMSFNPFFFPTDFFSFIFLIFICAITAEGVYFKGLEIRYTKSKSRRYLIARNSIRKSLVIIALAVALFVLLLLPFTAEALENSFQADNRGVNINMNPYGLSSTTYNLTIPSSSPFGLVYSEHIIIWLNGSGDYDVTVSSEGDIVDQWSSDTYSRSLTPLTTSSRKDYQVRVDIENGQGGAADVLSYGVSYRFSPILNSYSPILCIALIIIQMVSISIMLPIKELYATSSIYSKRYIEEKASGEVAVRLQKQDMTEAEIQKAMEEEARENAMLEEAVAIEDVVTADDEEHRVDGILRKKGDVDEGLALEEDVPCDQCGEMNSPHAALCFVCGAQLTAEAATIDAEEVTGKGDLFLGDRKFKEAIECYDHVLVHEARNIPALLGKSRALNMQGKWGLAVQYVNTILNLQPDNVEALILKGQILEGRGKLERALETYQQALDIDPSQKPTLERKEAIKVQLAAGKAVDEEADDEAVIEAFMQLPGIGLAKAARLYEAGFTSMDKLRAASEDDLARVKGISVKLAKKIKGSL